MAIHYLHSLGHTEIGYLHSTEKTGSIPEREVSYRSAMKAHGLSVNPKHIIHLDLFIDRAYAQMLEYLMKNPPLPTAFWADNDILATAAIRALQTLGYQVPEDVSILGTDDSYVGLISSPALSTLRIPKTELGELSVQRIHNILENPEQRLCLKTRVCVSLIQRDSVAAPRTMPIAIIAKE